MIRKATLLLALGLPLDALSAADQDRSGAFCSAQWPTDYRMQEFCMGKQAEGHKAVEAFLNRNGIDKNNAKARLDANDPASLIFYTCFQQWSEDYRMQAYCIGKQEEAAIRLGRLKKP